MVDVLRVLKPSVRTAVMFSDLEGPDFFFFY